MYQWHSCIGQPPKVGQAVRLMFQDAVGTYEGWTDCFLHDDGQWYSIDPPTLIGPKPKYWRIADGAEAVDTTR